MTSLEESKDRVTELIGILKELSNQLFKMELLRKKQSRLYDPVYEAENKIKALKKGDVSKVGISYPPFRCPQKPNEKDYDPSEDVWRKSSWMIFALVAAAIIIFMITINGGMSSVGYLYSVICVVLIFVLFPILGGVVQKRRTELEAQYKEDLANYKKKYNECKEKYDKECEEIKNAAIEEHLASLQAELEKLSVPYNECTEEMAQKSLEIDKLCASFGGMHYKYKTCEIVDKFREYLENGRCETVGEAINILENERRKNIIVVTFNVNIN